MTMRHLEFKIRILLMLEESPLLFSTTRACREYLAYPLISRDYSDYYRVKFPIEKFTLHCNSQVHYLIDDYVLTRNMLRLRVLV